MATLEDILKSANSYLDLEYATPTGTELTTRTDFANQAVMDAAALYRFDEFNDRYVIGHTCASVTLPSNFRELIAVPTEDLGNGSKREFPAIRWSELSEKNSSDYYCYLQGNPSSGFTLVFNGLTTQTTLTILFQRYPSGMATLTDICELPDPEYVRAKVVSYVLQSRSDARFPQAEADAQRRLSNMIGRQMIQAKGGTNRTPNNMSYVIGE